MKSEKAQMDQRRPHLPQPQSPPADKDQYQAADQQRGQADRRGAHGPRPLHRDEAQLDAVPLRDREHRSNFVLLVSLVAKVVRAKAYVL